MKCPRDGNPLQQLAVDKLHVDMCATCKGVWFDGGEMRLLVEQFASGTFEQQLKHWHGLRTDGHTPPKQFWVEDKLHCPVDSTVMLKHYFAGDSKIGIDNCAKCNGIWIDGDEMKALWEYNRPTPQYDIGIQMMIQDTNQFRKKMKEAKQLPYTLHNMIVHPWYGLYVMANSIVNLMVEEFKEAGEEVS